MQGPQAAEIEPGRDVEAGVGELGGDVDADSHAGQAPEQGHDREELHDVEIVVRQTVDLERRTLRRALVVALEDRKDSEPRADDAQPHMEGVGGLDRLGGDIKAEQAKDRENANEPDFAAP